MEYSAFVEVLANVCICRRVSVKGVNKLAALRPCTRIHIFKIAKYKANVRI